MNAPTDAPLTNAPQTDAPLNQPATQEERVLAGAGYLVTLLGFWLVGPAALYVWQRGKSRFVTFHAVQATLLNLAVVPVTGLAIVLAFAVQLGFVSALGRLGPWADSVAALLFIVVLLAVAGLPFAVTAWMGVSVMRGRARPIPLLGRFAEEILAK